MADEKTTKRSWQQIATRIRVPLGFVLAALYLWRAQPNTTSLTVGWGVALVGLWIRALASGYVRKNESLATSGPYAFCRNPLYLGSIVIGLGFALASLRWEIGVAMAVMFVAIYLPVIRAEESWLGAHFAEYAEYCRRVPRLLPRLLPAKSAAGEGGEFSLALYRKHREYNALIGATLLMAALIAKIFYTGGMNGQ